MNVPHKTWIVLAEIWRCKWVVEHAGSQRSHKTQDDS
jgi:hypothetical protein